MQEKTKKLKFNQLFKMPLSEIKNVVASEAITGNISVAQQLLVEENGEQRYYFLKNSLIFTKEQFFEFVDLCIKARDELMNSDG